MIWMDEKIDHPTLTVYLLERKGRIWVEEGFHRGRKKMIVWRMVTFFLEGGGGEVTLLTN